MNEVRFKEETKIRNSVIIWLSSFAIFIPILMCYTFFIIGSPIWVEGLLGILEAAFLFALMNFRKLVVRVSDDYLEFGYGILKDKVKLWKIKSCKIIEIKSQKYGGLGIQMEKDGSIAYVPRPGSCVKISVEGRRRDYIIYTKKPKELCDMLLRKK